MSSHSALPLDELRGALTMMAAQAERPTLPEPVRSFTELARISTLTGAEAQSALQSLSTQVAAVDWNRAAPLTVSDVVFVRVWLHSWLVRVSVFLCG